MLATKIDEFHRKLILSANKLIGKSYDAINCADLVKALYKELGVDITTAEFKEVPKSSINVGDIIFFDDNASTAVYLGSRKAIKSMIGTGVKVIPYRGAIVESTKKVMRIVSYG